MYLSFSKFVYTPIFLLDRIGTKVAEFLLFWVILRWLNTVLRAVSVNSRDGAFLKLDKQKWRRKSNVHGRRFLKIFSLKFCDIWHNFYFYRILNDEKFKMEGKEKKMKGKFCDAFNTEQLHY